MFPPASGKVDFLWETRTFRENSEKRRPLPRCMQIVTGGGNMVRDDEAVGKNFRGGG